MQMREEWRQMAVSVVIVAALAWTAYCLSFLLLMGTPAIEGAEEVAARGRTLIVGGLLAGWAVAIVAVTGLWRRSFDRVPQHTRTAVALVGLLAIGAIVVGAYWFGAAAAIVFLWGPLVGAALLLVGWASGGRMRRRLAESVGIWCAGFVGVLAVWIIFPRTLQDGFWLLVGLVSLAALAWWALGSARLGAGRGPA